MQMQEMGEEKPGRSGADDSDLGSRQHLTSLLEHDPET